METHYDKLNQKLDNLKTECSKCKKHQNHNQQQSFYPSTVSLTSITFTKEEQELLDLGTQHSIQPIEAYRTNLILETEHAIRLLDPQVPRRLPPHGYQKTEADTQCQCHTHETFTHHKKHPPQA